MDGQTARRVDLETCYLVFSVQVFMYGGVESLVFQFTNIYGTWVNQC